MIIKSLVMLIVALSAFADIKNKEFPVVFPLLCGFLSIIHVVIMASSGNLYLQGGFLSIIPGLIFIGLTFLTRQEIGMGDGTMMLGIGPVFGVEVLSISALFAMTLCGIYSIALIAFGKANKKTKIPFIPFLLVGLGVSLFAKC